MTSVLQEKEDWVCDVTNNHRIIEIGSAELIENTGSIKYVSTLLKKEELVGVISVIKVEGKTPLRMV